MRTLKLIEPGTLKVKCPYPTQPYNLDLPEAITAMRHGDPYAAGRIWELMAPAIDSALRRGLRKIAPFPHVRREHLEMQVIDNFADALRRLNAETPPDVRRYISGYIHHACRDLLKSQDDLLFEFKKDRENVKRDRSQATVGPARGRYRPRRDNNDSSDLYHHCEKFEHQEYRMYIDDGDPIYSEKKLAQLDRILRETLPLMLAVAKPGVERKIVLALIDSETLGAGYAGLTHSGVTETLIDEHLAELDLRAAQKRYADMTQHRMKVAA